ncbi:MAG: proline racemase family protein [Synergistaceae bacterium]|jgi:proline racemase|nr:proline racemase family protein [Synergistaceae bacterium]
MMQFGRMISCIDAHTAGEPVRIVTAGFPAIQGRTMLDKRDYVLGNLDSYRKLVMREPRGHDAMYGAILTQPVTEDGDIGVLFIENGGMGTMCGHGTIGVSKVVFDTGMFPSHDGVNTLRIDAPAGRVTSFVSIRNGRVDGVSFRNVPSFLYRSGVKIPVEGLGELAADICFGGAFYIFVDAAQTGLDVVPKNVSRLASLAMEIRESAERTIKISHPTEPLINWIYGTVITTPPERRGDRIRTSNITVFGEMEVDRSPCGTGTSARMAQLYSSGILKPGMTFENHSIIDTVFEGTIAEETEIAGNPAILPEIRGNAYIMGINQLVLEPGDPMPEGFRL